MKTEDIRSVRIAKSLGLTDLQMAILKTGAPILDADDVREYQNQRLAEEITKLPPLTLMPNPWYVGLRFALVLLAAGLSVGSGVMLFQAGSAGGISRLAPIPVILSALLLAAQLAKISFRMEVPLVGKRQPSLIGWRSHLIASADNGAIGCLRDYFALDCSRTISIPGDAMERVFGIAHTGAAADFFVDQLGDDPFLRVSAEDERESYYIAAWDERGFIR